MHGELIAWFYEATLTATDPVPRLETGVELMRVPPDGLDHPDLSTWHAPILARWVATRRS